MKDSSTGWSLLLPGIVAAIFLGSLNAHACATCFGQSDSPLAAGMNWGILSMLVVIYGVLSGVVAFFIMLGRRGRHYESAVAAAAPGTPGPSVELSNRKKED